MGDGERLCLFGDANALCRSGLADLDLDLDFDLCVGRDDSSTWLVSVNVCPSPGVANNGGFTAELSMDAAATVWLV